MEALVQRLEKYKSTSKSAKEEGNDGKARRLDRIVQVSYLNRIVQISKEDGMKFHKVERLGKSSLERKFCRGHSLKRAYVMNYLFM